MTDYRAVFDAHISFVNGGSLTAEGFRLDVPSADTPETEVARLLVQTLGLALVGHVRLSALQVVPEQHRGSRGVAAPPPERPETSFGLVDLSHTIREGLITYPGVPAPVITPHLTREESVGHYAPGVSFAMDIVTLPGNTGTYLDTAFHRYDGGADLAALRLETLVDLPTEVFHLTDARARGIPASVFYDRDVRGKAVLLHTGWDRHFGTPEYGDDAPFLTGDGVRHLAEQGVRLVGIDSLNIDDTSDEAHGERPAHSVFLASGVHVVEHMTNLGALPPSAALLTVAPPKVEGFGTFPVRAFAKVPAARG